MFYTKSNRPNKGTIVPLIALLLTAILAFGALVIDFSQGFVNKTKVKNAVDLAALAGISQLVSLQNVSIAKNTALQYLNDNLSRTLISFTPLTLESEGLSIQAGVYNPNTMTAIWDEANSNVNALMISYTYSSMTYLAGIFNLENIRIIENSTVVKQTAGGLAPGGGFPLAIQSSALSEARTNNNMIDLVQSGTPNSYFTAFSTENASANDINQILEYFTNQTIGLKPPSLTVGENFQINNGTLTTVYMNLDSSYFEGMIFISPIVTVDSGFANMVIVQGFVGYTINDVYMLQNDYHIAATIIPGYIDNRWSGLAIASGPGRIISPEDSTVLATSFGLIE